MPYFKNEPKIAAKLDKEPEKIVKKTLLDRINQGKKIIPTPTATVRG